MFAIIAPEVPARKWKRSFKRLHPEVLVLMGNEIRTPDNLTLAMVWKHKHGCLSKFKNLQLIVSMGAGVDHILSDKSIAPEIRICRIVDRQMAFSMSNYVIMAVLNHQRNWYEYDLAQKNRHWAQFEISERVLKIGILGIGHLGMDVAMKLHFLGFDVFGKNGV